MWLRVLISILLWVCAKSKPLGVNLKLVQSLVQCPHVVIDRIEQKGYSFTFEIKGGGIEHCLKDKTVFCRAESQYYFCRLMDQRVVTVFGDGGK